MTFKSKPVIMRMLNGKITFKDKQGSIIETVDVITDTSVMGYKDFILANNTYPGIEVVCGGSDPFVELVMYT